MVHSGLGQHILGQRLDIGDDLQFLFRLLLGQLLDEFLPAAPAGRKPGLGVLISRVHLHDLLVERGRFVQLAFLLEQLGQLVIDDDIIRPDEQGADHTAIFYFGDIQIIMLGENIPDEHGGFQESVVLALDFLEEFHRLLEFSDLHVIFPGQEMVDRLFKAVSGLGVILNRGI